jgi:hypothetical protein
MEQFDGTKLLDDLLYDVRKNKSDRLGDCSCKSGQDRLSLVAVMHDSYLFCRNGICQLTDWGSELGKASINFAYCQIKFISLYNTYFYKIIKAKKVILIVR